MTGPTTRFLRQGRLAVAAVLAVVISHGPGQAQTAASFRLADWEIERAIGAVVPSEVAPLLPRDFGLEAFPPPVIVQIPPSDAATIDVTAVDGAAVADAAPPALLPDPETIAIDRGVRDPAATLPRVASALRDLLARGATLRSQREEFASLSSFYASRRFEPLFVTDGALSDRGHEVLTRLAEARFDGLDPSAFRVDTAAASGAASGGAQGAAALELAVARAVARFAAQASAGRTDPRRLSRDLDVRPEAIDAGTALLQVSGSADVRAAIDAFNPPHEGFRRLRQALRQALQSPREMADTAEGRKRAALERDLVANLERWRWLPRDLGDQHIWVNIPDYDVEVVDRGQVVHRTRSIVGREETQTPVFSHRMNHIVFNPFWHVPHSIVRREMLGPASRDPGYFARRGIEVVRGGRVIDPATVDWSSANIGRFAFRQPPGERNALGRMKFMFPNEHAVYLHDTPTRALFSRDSRAFSHGCVRVQNPEELARVLLELGQPGQTWTDARVEGLYGERERTVRFTRPIPIHLVYFTVDVDENGTIRRFEDLYGHNARVVSALAGGRS